MIFPRSQGRCQWRPGLCIAKDAIGSTSAGCLNNFQASAIMCWICNSTAKSSNSKCKTFPSFRIQAMPCWHSIQTYLHLSALPAMHALLGASPLHAEDVGSQLPLPVPLLAIHSKDSSTQYLPQITLEGAALYEVVAFGLQDILQVFWAGDNPVGGHERHR